MRRRPGHKFAYLTFNRQVMLEAQTKFPKNTACLNFHKLAYAKYGFVFKDKMLRGSLRPHHAAETLGIAKNDERAALAIRTLSAFLISADDAVGSEHVPSARDVNKVYSRSDVRRKAENTSPEDDLVDMATRLWVAMKDKTKSMPMTDGGMGGPFPFTPPGPARPGGTVIKTITRVSFKPLTTTTV